MASRRRKEIRDQDLEHVLENVLNDSDVEVENPFAVGEDDELDEDYQVPEVNNEQSSSSSSDEEDERQISSDHHVQESRGRGRSRGRSRSRRGLRGRRGSRSRGRNAVALPSRSSFEDISGNDGDPTPSDDNDWVECSFEPEVVPFTEPAYLPVERSSFGKIDYFRQYIDDDLIENIVNKSNRSYLSRTGKCLNLELTECNTFIAMSLIMGVINYPTIRMYWSKKFRVPVIADSMPRNRFMLIKNSLKLVLDEDVNSEMKKKDKLWKVRPLIDAILKGCRLQQKTKDLSIDEMIIPFQGTCGLKQYCPGKPNPVGLKAFVLATPNGLVCNFHIYEGDTTYPGYNNTNFGLGEKAVLQLTEDLVPGHVIYCDRYFTSEKLVTALQERGLHTAGTLMKNRVPRTARHVLTDDKIMKKKPRGSWQVVVNKAKKIVITKWLDSKPISFMSNLHADQTIDSCERWSKREKKYVSVSRPQIVKLYNANMGGVDLADRMLAVCPFRYRTLKWTQRFIFHMMDLAVSNAWLLYREDELSAGIRLKKIQQLRSFKLEIGEALLEANADTQSEYSSGHESSDKEEHFPTFRIKKVPNPIPSETYRTRGANHLPDVSDTQNKCRQIGCRKKTKMFCTKCNIYLCLTKARNCFREFHSPHL